MNKPKRDYQFNIVKHCLFENTIVALPTGLGKTFIAGVVMLNCGFFSYQTDEMHADFVFEYQIDYRWFPDGKVVFVAPTKPLVAQQIDACHQVCGIPGSDAAELTGHIARPTRGRTVSFLFHISSWVFSDRASLVERKESVLYDAPNIHQ